MKVVKFDVKRLEQQRAPSKGMFASTIIHSAIGKAATEQSCRVREAKVAFEL